MKQILLKAPLFLILAMACRKPVETANPVNNHLTVSKMTAINVPDGFLWNSTKNIQIHIGLTDNPYPGRMQQLFFYDGNPATGAKLLLEGSVSEAHAFEAQIAVPTNISQLYMLRQTPDQSKFIEKFNIRTTNQIKKTIEKTPLQSFGKNAAGPDCNTGCITTVNNASGNLSYSTGTICLTGNFSIAKLTLNNSVIVRVCGTGNISNLKFNNKLAEFIVTSGGNVTFTSTTPIDGKFTNYGTVATLGNSNFNINGHALFTNNGTCHFSKSFNPNANSVIVNNGTIEVKYNLIHSSSANFTNNCQLIVHHDFDCNGLFKNYGYIKCDMEAKFSGGTNHKFSMYDGAMLSTKNIQVNSHIMGYNSSGVNAYSFIKVISGTKGNANGLIGGTIKYCDHNVIENVWVENISYPAISSCTEMIPITACNPEGNDADEPCLDTDEDGVCDEYDDYPNNPDKAFNIAGAKGTLGFEDLWPFKGDYDMNDVVIYYNYRLITNAHNEVVHVDVTYTLMATGGVQRNGFGVALPVLNNKILNLTGATLESNQTNAVLILFNNMRNEMTYWNTFPNQPASDDIKYEVTFDLAAGIPIKDFSIGPYNPFIWNNDNGRSNEIHLAGETPTNLANVNLFGTGDDNSVLATGQTYLSKNGGYPWAIHIPDSFEYPIEKVDINEAYLKFAEWAESGGLLHNDWYMNLQGYRAPSNIYKKN